jgi:maltooligosyltrehalose trehalohydrolase
MGEEIGSKAPFLYFTDHGPALAKAVREGRAREFQFQTDGIPDPNGLETFETSRPETLAPHASHWKAYYSDLLRIRREEIVPRLKDIRAMSARAITASAALASWRLADGAMLTLAANFGGEAAPADLPGGRPLWGDAVVPAAVPPRTTLVWLQ